eukprot:GHVR01190855.1.p1 GENE.GHVR01190855.1~~GHVR01190855.1.p1  ORF type:complete len:165 (-),score=35.08 GHVR01190855.1:469-963(-)
MLNNTHVALDIGGTLAKVVYICDADLVYNICNDSRDESTFYEAPLNLSFGKVRFHHFMTERISDLLKFLKENNLVKAGATLPISGGGAYKYESEIKEYLECVVIKCDEMRSLIHGLMCVLDIPNEVYRYDTHTKNRYTVSMGEPIFPFLVVNVGSGVSILKEHV